LAFKNIERNSPSIEGRGSTQARADPPAHAHFDFLTGLPNRTLFNQLLDHALTKAQRHARQLAILFIDLDGFKQINDAAYLGEQRPSRHREHASAAARHLG
jgi:PleD family two-component response regulator